MALVVVIYVAETTKLNSHESSLGQHRILREEGREGKVRRERRERGRKTQRGRDQLVL